MWKLKGIHVKRGNANNLDEAFVIVSKIRYGNMVYVHYNRHTGDFVKANRYGMREGKGVVTEDQLLEMF